MSERAEKGDDVGDTLWRRADEIIGAFVVSKWEQISPVVPGKVLSLVVDRNRLYVATERRGIFHISLEENNYLVRTYAVVIFSCREPFTELMLTLF